jgi:hypothetical protein
MEPINGLTYGDLLAALRSVGFIISFLPQATAARHPEGALIALPVVIETDEVLRWHYLTSRGTVENFGILDGKDFDLLIARQTMAKVAA